MGDRVGRGEVEGGLSPMSDRIKEDGVKWRGGDF